MTITQLTASLKKSHVFSLVAKRQLDLMIMEVQFYKTRNWHLFQHVDANTPIGFPSLGKTEVKYFWKHERKIIQVCKQKDHCLALVPSEIREGI